MPISDVLAKAAEWLARKATFDAADIDSRTMRPAPTAPKAQEEEREKCYRQQMSYDRSVGRIGRRYAGCSVKNYKLSDDSEVCAKQQAALDSLGKLAKNFSQHLESGGNLIIYGPPGTGKDHLLVALMKHAISCGCEIEWCNGQDLFGAFRDQIDSRGSEAELVRQYIKPEILAISDPVQPKGEASAYATSMLYRIIDGRYRHQKPTWFTVNVAGAKEAAEAISGPVFDRMRDNAVSVFCNWPSYRQTHKPEWLK